MDAFVFPSPVSVVRSPDVAGNQLQDYEGVSKIMKACAGLEGGVSRAFVSSFQGVQASE